MSRFDPTTAPDVAFLPLADPDRRAKDPIRALQAARDLRILIGAAEYDAVDWARRAGSTWAEVGESLAISKQAAQQRFGPIEHQEGCKCGTTAACSTHL